MKDFYKDDFYGTRWRYLLSSMLLVFLTLSVGNLKAQVSAYTFTQSAGTFTPITGGTLLDAATGNTTATALNSTVYPVTLPFAFNFNGQNYTALNVSTNGFITFGATVPSTTLTTPISSAIDFDGVVSAFGRDLLSFYNIAGQTGEIRWETVGTVPNREVVIEWKNFRPTNATSTTSVYSFSFQIRLQETTNTVSTVYTAGSYLVGSTSYSSAINQIGLRGATNADFNNRYNASATAFVNSVAGDANGDDQAFNTTNATPGMPSDGLTYTWTPPSCYVPGNFAASNILTTSADLTWTAPVTVPSSGYTVYYSMNNTAPDATTVLDATNSVSTANLTATLTGLNSSSVYFVWIRANCSSTDQSDWLALPTIATVCVPLTSMFENFDSYATGSIVPHCWARIVPATTPGTQTINATSPASGTRNLYQYASATTTPVIVVLPEFSNINAGTNWLRFKARVSTGAPGDLEVGYVTDAADAATFVLLNTLSITNLAYAPDTEYTVIIPTTVPANARIAIRNPSDAKGYYWDDVYWETIPTCFPPTALALTPSSVTSSGGAFTWTAPSTSIPTGYELYYTTSNTTPTAATVLDGTNSVSVTGTTATITGLAPSTVYFVWVRSVCSATDKSTWAPLSVTLITSCQPPGITGTNVNPTPVCMGGTATLTATADSGADVRWYDAATGGTLLATGTSFTTPVLTATTDYWVTAFVGGTGTVGMAAPTSTTGNSGFSDVGLMFDAQSSFTLLTVDLYPMHATSTAGTVNIALKNAAGTVLQSAVVNVVVSVAGAVNTVPLNFDVPAGLGHRLVVTAVSGITNLRRESTTGFTYPYTLPGVASITSAYTSGPSSTFYYYFYNWTVSTLCESSRTMVTATYDSTCVLGTSETENGKEISVYPNPFTDVVHISDVKDLKSVTVIDMSGRMVKSISSPGRQINLSELSAGLYILKLDYKDGTVKTVKAVKK